MSELETQQRELDFSKGFSLYAVIRVLPQRRPGRNVIFEMAHDIGAPKLTVGLDEQDCLKAWFTDAEEETWESAAIPKQAFFGKLVLLNCAVIPPTAENDVATLRLGVYDHHIKETPISANLGRNAPARFTIGAALDGGQNAAFELAELVIYQDVLTADQGRKFRQYVRQRLGV